MLVYHGSNLAVECPRIIQSERFLDFGIGFYTTTNYDQAVNFAHKVFARRKIGVPTVSHYEIDEIAMRRSFSVRKFLHADMEWLDYVVANRSGTYSGENFDIVYGPVANDDVYTTIAALMAGIIDRPGALAALKVRKLFNQLVFATPEPLSILHFIKYEEL